MKTFCLKFRPTFFALGLALVKNDVRTESSCLHITQTTQNFKHNIFKKYCLYVIMKKSQKYKTRQKHSQKVRRKSRKSRTKHSKSRKKTTRKSRKSKQNSKQKKAQKNIKRDGKTLQNNKCITTLDIIKTKNKHTRNIQRAN